MPCYICPCNSLAALKTHRLEKFILFGFRNSKNKNILFLYEMSQLTPKSDLSCLISKDVSKHTVPQSHNAILGMHLYQKVPREQHPVHDVLVPRQYHLIPAEPEYHGSAFLYPSPPFRSYFLPLSALSDTYCYSLFFQHPSLLSSVGNQQCSA